MPARSGFGLLCNRRQQDAQSIRRHKPSASLRVASKKASSNSGSMTMSGCFRKQGDPVAVGYSRSRLAAQFAANRRLPCSRRHSCEGRPPRGPTNVVRALSCLDVYGHALHACGFGGLLVHDHCQLSNPRAITWNTICAASTAASGFIHSDSRSRTYRTFLRVKSTQM